MLLDKNPEVRKKEVSVPLGIKNIKVLCIMKEEFETRNITQISAYEA